MLLFVAVLGVLIWLITIAYLLIEGTEKRSIVRPIVGVLILVLGLTFEIYGFGRWWMKP